MRGYGGRPLPLPVGGAIGSLEFRILEILTLRVLNLRIQNPGEERRLWSQAQRIRIPALPFISSVTLSKLPDFSVPATPHL